MQLPSPLLPLSLSIAASISVAGSLTFPQASMQKSAEGNQTVDRIVVVKSTRTMTLESKGQVLKTYKVALGGQPIGPKEQQGDHKTPEGDYVVDAKNAHSQFYLALHLSYPNATDRARARKLGVSPGGDVESMDWGRHTVGLVRGTD